MAIVTRTSNYALHSSLLSNINTVQTRLFTAQNQLSSGLKADSFSGFTGQVEQFTELEAKVRKSVNYQENNAVNISRLQTTQEHLSSIIDVVDEMENLMTLRRNPAVADDTYLQILMQSKIDAVAAELNATFGGKYLFSGTRSNVAPVEVDPAVPQPVTSGVADANYYRGSNEDIIMRADDNVEMEIRVRADDDAFQKIFAAAYHAMSGDTANDDDILVEALDLLQEGLDEVIALESSVNSDILIVEDISQRQNSLQLYWQGVTEEISKTDILSVSTQLAVDETVLTASFQAFAGINALSLVNFFI